MKISKLRLRQLIKEELEVILTNEEVVEIFGQHVLEQIENDAIREVELSGNTGMLANVAGRDEPRTEPPSNDVGTDSEQTPEDSLIGLLNNLGHLLDEWSSRRYSTDEIRYKTYFEDLQNLVEQYDPCAHRGRKCEESHPGQSHEECIETTIDNTSIKERQI